MWLEHASLSCVDSCELLVSFLIPAPPWLLRWRRPKIRLWTDVFCRFMPCLFLSHHTTALQRSSSPLSPPLSPLLLRSCRSFGLHHPTTVPFPRAVAASVGRRFCTPHAMSRRAPPQGEESIYNLIPQPKERQERGSRGERGGEQGR